MKIGQTLKVIDAGWISKTKGYRVRYQRKTDAGLETEYTPDIDDAPLDSDVAAWRTAWKLCQATIEENTEFGDGKMINILVVDDSGEPVKYYKTNEYKVYNEINGNSAG
jgi:hypothetical protein